jgi:large subunit ribosomal protein L27Ae
LKKNRKKRGSSRLVMIVSGCTGSTRGKPVTPVAITTTRILMDKYHPGYFRKVGMQYFHKKNQKYHCPIINLEKVWPLLRPRPSMPMPVTTTKSLSSM